MKGLWYLSWRHALANRTQTLVLTLCIAVSVFLPVCANVLLTSYERDLTARAAGTPLIAGAKGNRFDLVLTSLYYRESALDTVPFSQALDLQASGLGLAIPLHVRFTAQSIPVVGTSPEYFERRGLAPSEGTLPLLLGEVVLGAGAAAELGLHPGDALFSDQREIYDISKPPALKMRVSGILSESGSPDDGVVFVDLKTCWILEGLAHGHQDVVAKVDEAYVLDRTEENVAVSQAMIEYNEVTPENVASYHYHGDPSNLPLSSVLFYPRDEKASTILRARVNATRLYQMLIPAEVIADLMAFVFRIKTLFDGISALLAATTLLMTILVLLLSMRVRAQEMRTLNRIGCSRHAVARLYGTEILLVLAASLVLAAIATGLTLMVLPDLITMF